MAMDAAILAPLRGVGLLLLACYQFLGISVLCDAHLCPTLEKLCELMRMPTALAAASLISAGSSAPELMISAFGAAGKRTELSIPAVLTSALIAFAAIPPMVVLAVGQMKLRMREVLRDAVSYAACLVMFISFNQDFSINAVRAFALVMAYFLYLYLVYVTSPSVEEVEDTAEKGRVPNGDCEAAYTKVEPVAGRHCSGCVGSEARRCEGCARKVEVDAPPVLFEVGDTPTTACTSNRRLSEPLLAEVSSVKSAEEEATEETTEEGSAIVAALQRPFEVVFRWTVPDTAAGGFVASMAWLCLLSYASMECASKVAELWGLGQSTAGVTLLAWGGQLPDAIAAVSLARAGMPDEAISQAIASQVINVSIGLGLPLLTYSCLTGKPTVTAGRGATNVVAFAVLLSIVAYLGAMVLGGGASNKPSPAGWVAGMTRSRALALGACFIGLYGLCVAAGEGQLGAVAL